jgi:hypothetical protein
MRKTVLLALAGCAALLTLATTTPPEFLRNDAPAVETRISIAPVTKDAYQLLRRSVPGLYRCSVLVREAPGSRRVLGTKDLILAAGEHVEETELLGTLSLKFEASIGKSRDQADATATLTRDGKIISRQVTQVMLTDTKTGK